MNKERRLEIPLASGMKLAGVLHIPDDRPKGEPTAGVLICHGMLSYKDSPKHLGLARQLAEKGLAVLRFDFQGRGDSPGDLMGLSFTRQVIEARAALETLRRETGVERFALVGSSMGGAVATILAASGLRGLEAMVTFAAVARPADLGPRMVDAKGLAVWRDRGWLDFEGERVGIAWFDDAQVTEVLGPAARVSCPWLILHGEQDDVVPVEESRALHEACPVHSRLEIITGADHQFNAPEHLAQIMQRAVAFLSDALMP
ncbi:MAG: alpha/beta fold hydrolase [Deltaproteobacteria bacterium]|nr:alpha/beta fold hydrolase [Deltaproteobacteria bacterium]